MPDTPPTGLLPPAPVLHAEAPDPSKAMTLFVMIMATLYFGREVLIPVTLALLLAFLLAPLVALLRRLHLGRVPSVLVGVVVALGIILAIGGVIGGQIAQLTTNLPLYVATIEAKVTTVRTYTLGRLAELADLVGPHTVLPATTGSSPSSGAAIASRPQTQAVAPPEELTPLVLAERFLSPVFSPLVTLGIVFIIAVFALLQQEDLRDRLIRLLGSDDLRRTTVAIDDGGRRLSRYFLTQLSVNTTFGIVIGIGLLLIGVPYPILFGILSALLRFVPYVGSPISAVLAIALAAAVEPGWSLMLWTAGLYLVVEISTAQVVEPMIYGHSTGLSPFSVVVAAIFWSWLWGPIGLILSTPLTLCLVVIGRHVKRLEFLEVMLGDRPALTPIESFYQRILAGDADEAQDHAELLLKDRSLSTYYDEVAIRALQLAANDALRGVLSHEQLDRVKSTTNNLVHGLEDQDDEQPLASKSDGNAMGRPADQYDVPRNAAPLSVTPATDGPTPWLEGSPVMCIAGRGPLDEAASAMLVQLLGKHGIGGRLVAYDDVSRERISTLDIAGVKMACISYLDISGDPAHLRDLMQRLRSRLPKGTPILIGLWPPDDSRTRDSTIKSHIGADYFTSSLAEAVSLCSKAALNGGSR